MPAPQSWYRWNGAILELRVKVQPQCRDEGLAGVSGDCLRVRVKAPPVDGKANKRLLAILAEAFGVAKSRVQLVHGAGTRQKWIRVEHPEIFPEPVRSALDAASRVEKTTKAV